MDGVFDCQILNYLSLNCTNDIHEDLLDFNMQLIHCTKTGLCLSDFVLVLWWVTLKEVWTLSRGQAGIPGRIFLFARAKKTCRKAHVENNALIWISSCGTFPLLTHVHSAASNLSCFSDAPLPCGQPSPFCPLAEFYLCCGHCNHVQGFPPATLISAIFLLQYQAGARKVGRLYPFSCYFGPVPTYLLQTKTWIDFDC